MFKVQSETRAEMTSLVDELVGNEHLVRAFGYESRAEERFDKINLDLQKLRRQGGRSSPPSPNPCTRFVNALVYAAVGVLGAIRRPSRVASRSVSLSGVFELRQPVHEAVQRYLRRS